MNYDIYLNECFEIGAALESLLNLSDIIEDIAMEAPTTVAGVDEKKKNLAVKKLADAWVDKFKKWENKFDKPVQLVPGISEADFAKKAEKIINTFNMEAWDSKNPHTKVKEEINNYIDELKTELRKVKKNTGKDPVVKSGPFKALRTKLAASMKKNAALVEKEGYAEAIKEQIKISNEILRCFDMLAKPYKTGSDDEIIDRYIAEVDNTEFKIPRMKVKGEVINHRRDNLLKKQQELQDEKKK